MVGLILFPIILITAVAARSTASLNNYIVGGSLIDIEKVPFQVSLRYSGEHNCGGTLISKNWILSAAHCGCPDTSYMGSSNNQEGGIEVKVIDCYKHKNFEFATVDFDYMLLKLDEYDPNGLPIGFATLPEDNEKIPDKTMLLVSGWGDTLSSSDDRRLLRSVEVPKVNEEECENVYAAYGKKITDRMFCAGYKEGGKDSCQGDSGGQIVLGNKIFGIVSWGYGCAKPNAYGVYAKVSYVRKWIQNITGI